MNRKAHYLFPSQSRNCKRQWDRFRSAQSRRTKLPGPLWQAAVEPARQHGMYAVAQPPPAGRALAGLRISGTEFPRAPFLCYT